MTRPEFMSQFDRLCKGFRYDATPEQSEAWFKRIGHGHPADWREAVDVLLCAPRFPLLDPVLAALEQAQGQRKRLAVTRDKPQAESVFERLRRGEGAKLSPTLFAAIKAFAGREQVRRYLALERGREERREQELVRLAKEEARLTRELADLVPQLDEHELSDFVGHYGPAVAA